MAGKGQSAAERAWNTMLASMPAEAEFEIQMNIDSTTEVWDDIETGINAGEAWEVFGMEWNYENNASPFVPIPSPTADNAIAIQVHRNVDNETLLRSNDNAILMEQVFRIGLATNGLAYSFAPYRVAKHSVTFSERLRVMFRTATDLTLISATTISVVGKIFYQVVPAPNNETTKLGRLSTL